MGEGALEGAHALPQAPTRAAFLSLRIEAPRLQEAEQAEPQHPTRETPPQSEPPLYCVHLMFKGFKMFA
jgi:hypothetical protein